MARAFGVKRFVLWGLGLVVGAVLVLQLWYFLCILFWTVFNPSSTAFMSAQESALRQKNPSFQLKQAWVPYSKISPHLKRAVIAAEDANFVDHDGVDWEAVEKAWEANQKKGKPVRGGSTITMQLAKNLFLSGDRSYWRKGQELIITWMLEAVMSKQRILEIYLNVAEWGIGVFGVEAAAKHYFSLHASQLGPAQAAKLAAMLPRPRFYDRNRQSVALGAKTALVMRRMSAANLP